MQVGHPGDSARKSLQLLHDRVRSGGAVECSGVLISSRHELLDFGDQLLDVREAATPNRSLGDSKPALILAQQQENDDLRSQLSALATELASLRERIGRSSAIPPRSQASANR